jgi:hypothetical protein
VAHRRAADRANRAAAAYLKASPTSYSKAADIGIDINTALKKYLPSLGANYDEALGAVGRGSKGNLRTLISEAEKTIQDTAQISGKNIRISGDDVIKALKSEKKALVSRLGESEKATALDEIVKQAEKKYKGGVTVKKAIEILRDANSKFGRSIVDENTNAVAASAQKLEANTFKRTLKKMFPDLKDALETQSDLYTLEPILKGARAKDATKGFNITVNPLDLLSKGPNRIVNRPEISSRISQVGTGPVARLLKAGVKPTLSQTLIRSGSGQEQTSPEASLLSPTIDSQTVSMPDTTQSTNYDRSLFEQAIIRDLAETGGKNDDKLIKVSQFLENGQKTGNTKMSDTAIKRVNEANSALGNLENLQAILDENEGTIGPVTGQIKAWIPGSQTQMVQSEINRVKQVVGKALEGGVLRKEDEEKYKKILPTINDTPAVARYKIKALYQSIQRDLNDYMQLQGKAGTGQTTQEDSLGALLEQYAN